MNYISVYNIINKFNRDFGIDINEDDAIEWIGEALRAIEADPVYMKKTKFFPVKNNKVILPSEVLYINRIIRIMNYEGKCLCDDDAAYIVYKNNIKIIDKRETDSPCEIVNKLCSDIIFIKDIDINSEEFRIVRLASDDLFGIYECKDNCNKYLPDTTDYGYDKYKQIGTDLVFSFKTGFVAIEYLTYVLDKNGFPLIPDLYNVITAITHYLLFKWIQRQFYLNASKIPQTKLSYAREEWLRYARQARAELKMPNQDELQNLYEAMINPFYRERYYQLFSTAQKPVINWNKIKGRYGEE